MEALCWLAVSGVILLRHSRKNSPRRELWYALSFFAFGGSDVIETCGTTPLLLLFKGACLLAITGFRPEFRALYGNRLLCGRPGKGRLLIFRHISVKFSRVYGNKPQLATSVNCARRRGGV